MKPPLALGLRLKITTRHCFFGGLFYGWVWSSVIACLHVRHNSVHSVWDLLLLHAYFFLIYALPIAAVCMLVGLFRGITSPFPAEKDSSVRASAIALGIAVGLTSFTLSFFLFNYAVPFDHYPFIESYRGMLLLVAARSAVMGVCAWLVGVLAASVHYHVAKRPARRPVCLVAVGMAAFAIATAAVRGKAPSYTAPEHTEHAPLAEQVQETGNKVLLIGLDGATWRVMSPMLKAGELPHLASLVQRGVRGELKSMSGADSPVIWSTVYTGKGKDKHGILDFFYLRFPGVASPIYPLQRIALREMVPSLERTGLVKRVLTNSSHLPVMTVWEILGRHGKSVGIVGGVNAWPATAVNGYYVTEEVKDSLSAFGRSFERIDPTVTNTLFHPPGLLPLLDRHQTTIENSPYWQGELAVSLVQEEGQRDFLFVFNSAIDFVQHKHWKELEPRYYFGKPPGNAEGEANPVRDAYRAWDALIGRLLSTVAEDTTVMVISDHGSGPIFFHLEQQAGHRWGPPGVLIMVGPGVRQGVTITSASVYDVTPTVLALLGLPVGRDMDGRVLDEALTAEFLASHPVQFTASYERAPVRGKVMKMRPRDEELLERLRSLGYVR